MGIRGRRRAVLLGTIAAATCAWAGAGTASAADRVDRVVADGWGSPQGSVFSIEQLAPTVFETTLVATRPNSCFHEGQVVQQFEGAEPNYTGTMVWALLEDGVCTGEFLESPATFSLETIGHVSNRDSQILLKWSSENPVSHGTEHFDAHRFRADTDGDSIADDDEISGINSDGDAEIEVDLPAMGADPNHKDIFVEVDQMETHPLDLAVPGYASYMFANAPVSNPDGSTGIALHVDAGPNSLMNLNPVMFWGGLSRSDTFPHLAESGPLTSDDEDDWSTFDSEYKFDNFEEARDDAFHYAVSLHGLNDPVVIGLARKILSSDFVVASGRGCGPGECNVPPFEQAATFVHELGHNLGLRHGGADNVNHKPNQHSVMNYAFSSGIPLSNQTRWIDYSRSVQPALDEISLNENLGVQVSVPLPYLSVMRCPPSTPRAIPINQAVDFDCDGTLEGSVLTSINTANDGTGELFETLNVVDEWALVRFNGGGVGGAARSELPTLTESTEPDPESYYETRDLIRSIAPNPPGPPAGPPDGPPTLPPAAVADAVKPQLKARVRSVSRTLVRVKIKATDETAVAQFSVGKKGRAPKEVEAKAGNPRKRVYRTIVSKGTRLKASAADLAGNTATLKVRAKAGG